MRIPDCGQYLVKHYMAGLHQEIPILLVGPIGEGKSSIVRQVRNDLEAHYQEPVGLIDLRISQLDSVDFRGIPTVVNGHTAFNPPNLLPFTTNTNHPKRGILFLDEVTLGDRLVRACCYQLILDRCIGDHKIKPDWLIVAATNRAEDKCDIDELPAALRNRFQILFVSNTIQDYSDYIKDKSDATVKFLKMNPANFRGSVDEYCFATARSWERVKKICAAIPKTDPLLRDALFGCIGKVADDYVKFLTNDTVYTEKVLDILKGVRLAPLTTEDIRPVYELLCAALKEEPSPQIATKILRYTRSLTPEKIAIAFEVFNDRDPFAGVPKDVTWQSEIRLCKDLILSLEKGTDK